MAMSHSDSTTTAATHEMIDIETGGRFPCRFGASSTSADRPNAPRPAKIAAIDAPQRGNDPSLLIA
jgi:hypothetical protein